MTLIDDPAVAELDGNGEPGMTVDGSAQAHAPQCPNRNGSGSFDRTGSRAGSRGSRNGSRGSRNGSRSGTHRGGSRTSRGSFTCPGIRTTGASVGEVKRPNTSDGQKVQPPPFGAQIQADATKAQRPGTMAAVSTAASTVCQWEDPFPPPPADCKFFDDLVAERTAPRRPVADPDAQQSARTTGDAAEPTGAAPLDGESPMSGPRDSPHLSTPKARPQRARTPLSAAHHSHHSHASSDGASACEGESESDDEQMKRNEWNYFDDKDRSWPPVPHLEKLCGRCGAAPITDVHARFPSKVHGKKRRSMNLKKLTQRELKRFLRRNSPVHKSIDDIEVPPPMATSFFSRKSNPRLPLLSREKSFRLEVSVLQHKVKEPLMKETIESMGVARFQDRFREMKEELERATLRIIVSKPMHQRSFEESVHLIGYLRKRYFFRDLPISVLNEITKHLSVMRYRTGQTIYTQGTTTTGVYILLKGVVTFPTQAETDRQQVATVSGGFTGGSAMRSSIDVSPLNACQAARRGALVDDRQDSSGPTRFNVDANQVRQVIGDREANDEISGGGNVIGVSDLLDDMSWPVHARQANMHLHTAVSSHTVEALFCPATKLLPLLEEEALREKIAVLQEYFPPTKGWQEKVLSLHCRIERNGKRVLIHELFDMRDVCRNTVLYQGGERPPLDVARISVVVSGTVNLKARGRHVDNASTGTLLGDEVLRGEAYTNTSTVVTPKARIMSISVSDYIIQFDRGLMPALQQQQQQPNQPFLVVDSDEEDTNQDTKAVQAEEEAKTNEKESDRKGKSLASKAKVEAAARFKRSRDLAAGALRTSVRITDDELSKYHPLKLPQRIAPLPNEASQRHRQEDFGAEESVRRRYLKERGRTQDQSHAGHHQAVQHNSLSRSRPPGSTNTDQPRKTCNLSPQVIQVKRMLQDVATPKSVGYEGHRHSTREQPAAHSLPQPVSPRGVGTRPTICRSGGFQMTKAPADALREHKKSSFPLPGTDKMAVSTASKRALIDPSDAEPTELRPVSTRAGKRFTCGFHSSKARPSTVPGKLLDEGPDSGQLNQISNEELARHAKEIVNQKLLLKSFDKSSSRKAA